MRRLAVPCFALLASCGEQAAPPPPRAPTDAAVAGRAPLGVWYEAPRADDPQFPIVNGREGAEALWTLELPGSGVAMIDYDHDGDLDLYFVVGRRPCDPADDASDRLFRNRGDGTFEDVTDAAGVREQGYGFGCAVGDYDGDGWDDLFVSNWGPDRLLRNRGDGTFEDVTEAAGVTESGWSTGAAFGDYDDDGDLDLYVCRYFVHDMEHPPNDSKPCPYLDMMVPCGPHWLPPERDLLWRNDHGRFTEVSAEAGMQNVRPSYGFGVTFCDVDADGKLDVFVANDSLPHFVFRNLGGGKFEEIGALTGLSASIDGRMQAGMGVDVGDYDGDGREDFVVTSFAGDYDTLYHNAGTAPGDALFDDVTQSLGLAQVSWWPLGWGTRFFDADCDGDLDLFAANGHVFPTVDGHGAMKYAQLNHLYLQQEGSFKLVSEQAGPGLQLVKPSRGAAFGDLNGDGWIDVVVSERNLPPSILRATPQPGVHRLLVELQRGANQRAIDHSIVTAKVGGKTMMRRMNRGGSFCSSNDPRVHFGLGSATVVDELTIQWRDGSRQTFRDVAADQLVHVRAGATELAREALK